MTFVLFIYLSDIVCRTCDYSKQMTFQTKADDVQRPKASDTYRKADDIEVKADGIRCKEYFKQLEMG